MKKFDWLLLQLFAGEGSGGDGGGEGAATGENGAVDAGRQALLDLGVPADKIRNRAKTSAVKAAPREVEKPAVKEEPEQQTEEQVAAANNPAEEETEAKPRMTWEEILKDPEYNKQIQAVVQGRLRSAKAAEETLGKLTPALEVLARKYGLDPAKPDYDALSQAIHNEDEYYEDRALELGVPVATAKRIDQEERETARQQRIEAMNLEEQRIRNHFQSLESQAEAMKKVFPKFDLRTELQNPSFAKMTAPNIGMSVEDAYYAVHRKEIQAAAMQVTAQKTAQKLSNSIQAGGRRPNENGVSGQAPSVTSFNYKNASREQREALKRKIYEAAANGRKIFPGQE